VVNPAAATLSPASRAGLPARSARVIVGPPLLASAAIFAAPCAMIMFVASGDENAAWVESSMRLWPPEVMVPPDAIRLKPLRLNKVFARVMFEAQPQVLVE